jgi:MFS family permease
MSVYFVLALSLINAIAIRAGRVVLSLFALDLGAQPVTIGLLAATFSVFPVLLSWHTGRLSDRFGSRWLLVFSAALGGLGMLVPFFWSGMAAIFVAGALTGISFAVYNVALQNLVGLLSKPEDLARNFSNYGLMMAASAFIGPLIGGFSIDHASHALACLYLALLSVIPALMLVLGGGGIPSGQRHADTPHEGLRGLLTDSAVRKMLITSSLMHSGQDLFQFYLPVYAHGIGLSASAIGTVLAVSSAGAFLSRVVLTRLITWLTEAKVLAYAFFAGAVSFLLIPFFKLTVVLAVIAFLFGMGMGCGQPIVMMLMFSRSAEGRSGETLGLRMTVNHLTRLVGPVIFGSIASVTGLAAVFWINALLLGSGGVLSRNDPVGRR